MTHSAQMYYQLNGAYPTIVFLDLRVVVVYNNGSISYGALCLEYRLDIEYIFDIPSEVTVDVMKDEVSINKVKSLINLPDELKYELFNSADDQIGINIIQKSTNRKIGTQYVTLKYMFDWNTILPKKITLNCTELEFFDNYSTVENGQFYEPLEELRKTLPQLQNYYFVFDLPLSDTGSNEMTIYLYYHNDYWLVSSVEHIPVEFKNSSARNTTDQATATTIKEQIKNTTFNFHFEGSEFDFDIATKQVRDILNITSDKINVSIALVGHEIEIAVFINDVYYGIETSKYTEKYDGINSGSSSGSSSNNNTSNNNITKTDITTNVRLEAKEGIIPSNTVMEVEEIATGETYNTVRAVLADSTKFKVFDITLKSNGIAIQPNRIFEN